MGVPLVQKNIKYSREMEYYYKLSFTKKNQDDFDIISYRLSDCEGFEETGDLLLCYIARDKFDKTLTDTVADELGVNYTIQLLEPVNWNATWESNFPVQVIDDFVAIRAHFHPPVEQAEHQLLITPKMSFGTGHHATTYMMVQQMRGLDFTGKKIFDFGTGTGVLAILAALRGADSVYAIDDDTWSVENALENVQNNNVPQVTIALEMAPTQNEQFDIILANINRNILLENMAAMAGCLTNKGHLLMSGLLKTDESDIIAAAEMQGLNFLLSTEKNGWIALLFEKE